MNTAQEIVTRLSAEFEMTDKRIADLVGSTQPTIWRIRTGQTLDCSASLYVRLSGLMEKVGAGETAEAMKEAA